jgi:hypothetical protein
MKLLSRCAAYLHNRSSFASGKCGLIHLYYKKKRTSSDLFYHSFALRKLTVRSFSNASWKKIFIYETLCCKITVMIGRKRENWRKFVRLPTF